VGGAVPNAEVLKALALATALCLVWALAIQVPTNAKVNGLHFGRRIFTYFVVCEVLYSVTTLFAFVVLKDRALPGPSWVWAALIGVFGFEFVVKRLGVAVGEGAQLSFDDWMSKSLMGASAEAVQKEAIAIERWAATSSVRLSTDPNLDTYVTVHLGGGKVSELEGVATQNHANAGLVKAFALAQAKPQVVAALMQGRGLAFFTRRPVLLGLSALLGTILFWALVVWYLREYP
jgi:hypothetical protein